MIPDVARAVRGHTLPLPPVSATSTEMLATITGAGPETNAGPVVDRGS